ncbi:hypothetical protein COV61_05145 [Candidatus Micrarchaeota archaeon CG11_big_fil_rev_8_21_14_0_20_47_5]|nr:MAG: hypothetical protein AUJ17_01130 [Candidatus Micrarchaeota archaeon CG1_02_47_40]PIN82729.1 MAG: hypothetical protein COV61_05145 [Candidatus Micrarchaeota archaeon CG11_big_fil_rev_8_21_14_0_20_47_5]
MEDEEIVKARFFIEPEDEKSSAQHIGCRLVLTEKMIHAGFKKGMVFNLLDGTVEVALEGPKKEIESFHAEVKKHLVEWLLEKSNDREKLKKLIGNPGISITELELKPKITVLDIGLYSHSLEMNQLGKGVDVYYELVDAIRDLKSTNRDIRDEIAKGRQ